MRLVFALFALALASGCGGLGVKVDHVSCDRSAGGSTLLVWCNTVRLATAPAPVEVHVEWNGYEGVGGLEADEAPEKKGAAVVVSRIGAFAPSESDYRLANSMRIRVVSGTRLLTQRLLPPPPGLSLPGTTAPPAPGTPSQPAPAASTPPANQTGECPYCGQAFPRGAPECPSCGASLKKR